MDVWISESNGETVTDPETGEIVHRDQTVEDFAESMLHRLEQGATVEELADQAGLDEFLICVAFDVARKHRARTAAGRGA